MPKYKNLDGTTPGKGVLDLLKWKALDPLKGKKPRPDSFVTPVRHNDGKALASDKSNISWIGHASFAMKFGGQTIATDPIFAERVGHHRRRAKPGIAISDLPNMDIVTVSHAHYDHMDVPSLRSLNGRTLFIVPKDCGEVVRRAGIDNVIELEWWQSHQHGDVRITLVPAQHWSMRTLLDHNKRLWGGYVYESPDGVAYHAGDTAYSESMFEAIAARFPRIDWAMIPIGAYEPEWFLSGQHMGPEEAGRAFLQLRARHFLAMHWGTFKLTDEPLGEPPDRLRAWFTSQGLAAERLWVFDVGESRLLE